MDKKRILCDMHVHSQNSHDSTASVADTAKECIKRNIYAFAVTDHCDIQLAPDLDVFTLVEKSLNETAEAEKQFPEKVKILKGIELGEALWNMPYANRILSELEYDVVIGSVHAVRYNNYTDAYSTIDFSKFTATELFEYMKRYFDDVLEMLCKVECDIMAHLTCPLRYINGKFGLGVDSLDFESQINKILDYIIENNIALEVNTSGLGAAYGELMPEKWIIKAFKEKGGFLVTLGSDAHISKRVGNAFDEVIELLKECGFDSYYYFEKRKPVRCFI